MATPITLRAIWGRLKILKCPGIDDIRFDSATQTWRYRDQMLHGANHRWAFLRPMHAEAIIRDMMAKWLGEPLPDITYLANKVMELEVRQRQKFAAQGGEHAVRTLPRETSTQGAETVQPMREGAGGPAPGQVPS